MAEKARDRWCGGQHAGKMPDTCAVSQRTGSKREGRENGRLHLCLLAELRAYADANANLNALN